MRICVLLVFLFNFITFSLNAQVFSDVTSAMGIAALNATTMYGTGSSCFDVNEDGWDDLTICISGGATRLYMNLQGVFQLHATFENVYDAKTCLWGDYDEDGDNDLFIIKRDGPSQLFVQTDSLVFVNQTSLLNFPFWATNNSFGAALGDYNRDSYLDLYVANYSTASVGGIKSTFFTNNQQGSFSRSPHGYNRNHFQPAFIDLFRDLYQDLFIMCDFRTGNELYTQNASGVFTDQTQNGAFGLSGILYLDAMTNSWCDYDNDSDLDLYVANTPIYGNFLFQNDGSNNFSNVAPAAGAALYKWSWSSLWFDLENDGWNDLVVSERHINLLYLNDFDNHVLRNNQGVFSEDNNTGISNLPYGYFTSAKGDFNNDGLYDLYLGAETGQQSRVFQNNTITSNNYVKCRLKGRLSNRNGVGTYIDYYLNGEHRVHYTQLGENYLCQNSQNYIFGIGEHIQIDSLELHWLSGVVEHYYNIPANTMNVFAEGETMPQIEASKTYLCPNGNDSLLLSVASWPLHLWSNGSSANSIWVSEPGNYSVTVGTGFGHTIQLNYVVEVANADVFQINSTPVLCAGDSTGTIEVVNLSTNQLVFSNQNVPAGTAVISLTVAEGCVVEKVVFIDEPTPFVLQVDSIRNACYMLNDGAASIQAIGGSPPYSGFNDVTELLLNNLAPGLYTEVHTDANGCPASYSFMIIEIPEATVEITSANWVCPNESIVFNALVSGIENNYFWDGVGPGALLAAGDYLTAVVDSIGCVTSVYIHIQEEQAPTVQVAVVSESIFGLGSIALEILGNSAPYIATWQSGFVGLNYSDLTQGNYPVSIAYGLGCTVDTSFTVLFDFIEEQGQAAEFLIDWKLGILKYTGAERLFDVEVYNAIGQLILSNSSIGTNDFFPLRIEPQMIYISTSKGNFKTKVVLP